MKYGSGSSTYPYGGNGSNNTQITKQIEDLQNSLSELENIVRPIPTQIGNLQNEDDTLNSSITDLRNRLSTAETKLSDYDTNINTQVLTADDINAQNLNANRVISDFYQWRLGNSAAAFESLVIKPGTILFAKGVNGSLIVKYSGKNEAIIVSSYDDDAVNYSISGDSLYININEGVDYSYIGDSQVITTSYPSGVSIKKGTTVIGNFYAELTHATFDDITIVNTLDTNKLIAEQIGEAELDNEDNRVKKAYIADAEINKVLSDEINAETENIVHLNTSRLNTKTANKETIEQHGANESYLIEVPFTNGNWQIELISDDGNANGFKANIQKVNGAAVVEYSRNSKMGMHDILVDYSSPAETEKREKSLFFRTYHSGPVYYSYQALNDDEHEGFLKIWKESDYHWVNPEGPLYTYEAEYNERSVLFGGTDVAGDFKVDDLVADKVEIKLNDDNETYYPLFARPLPEGTEPEVVDIFVNEKIKINPAEGSVEATEIKVDNKLSLPDSIDSETDEIVFSPGTERQYIDISKTADGTTLRPKWETPVETSTGCISNSTCLISEKAVSCYNGTVAIQSGLDIRYDETTINYENFDTDGEFIVDPSETDKYYAPVSPKYYYNNDLVSYACVVDLGVQVDWYNANNECLGTNAYLCTRTETPIYSCTYPVSYLNGTTCVGIDNQDAILTSQHLYACQDVKTPLVKSVNGCNTTSYTDTSVLSQATGRVGLSVPSGVSNTSCVNVDASEISIDITNTNGSASSDYAVDVTGSSITNCADTIKNISSTEIENKVDDGTDTSNIKINSVKIETNSESIYQNKSLYVGRTLSTAELAQLDDDALVIMGE